MSTDYLAALAAEFPDMRPDPTAKTDKRGGSVSYVSTPPADISEKAQPSQPPWPYKTAAEEPRCTSCRHYAPIIGRTWDRTGEAIADCTLHGFEVLELDNCKLHTLREDRP